MERAAAFIDVASRFFGTKSDHTVWNSAPRAKANDLGNDAITWYIASGILEVVGARPSNAILLAFALRG